MAAEPTRQDAPAVAPTRSASWFSRVFALRGELPLWQALLWAALCIVCCFGLWWFLTRGAAEERIVPPSKGLTSPGETFAQFHSLWFDRELTRNTFVSLKRLTLGFGLAVVVGVPLGVLCGCFAPLNAFFTPLSIFGRNIPVAALIPLTYSLFDIGEEQKIMFIFIACVAFIISDTARAIGDVGIQYVDTAYTLGANAWQVVIKVLVPLAMPSIFNSCRLLFGLAFGYIMLAETIKFGAEAGGLGDIINVSQRLSHPEHIILILLLIPLLAFGVDRLLFWIQRELFPYRYGGSGILNVCVRALLHGWESVKGLVIRPRALPALVSTNDKKATP